ncbi:flagellar biosynthetic protein FliO [Oricola cellulosilytica]|uniref:Uncharacterized protein n=1 Tax=Oricola cellulosilytica TaxID=1429082 RepID=A0A4R0P656_9HYPH|nr:flagellar biosynthetic protein FliO [Oricola cellulosilytica]TCD10944.1 hypothetical protein E0D97_17760 [Oricola cellulosilytica]
MRGGVFIAGSRGRKPRLAVVDAAAVDSHRRIVLVRRDDVEHLVMIGGHNDMVIERNIGISAAIGEQASIRNANHEQSTGRGQTKVKLVPENPGPGGHRPVSADREHRGRQEPVLHSSASSRPTAVEATSAVQHFAPPFVDDPSFGAKQEGEPYEVRASSRVEEPIHAPSGDLVHSPAPIAEKRTPGPRDEASLENEMEKLLAELSDK